MTQLAVALQPARGLSLAPGGPQADAGAVAQLGLDGGAYVPAGARSATDAGAAGEPSLGPYTEFHQDPDRPPERPAPVPPQLWLGLQGRDLADAAEFPVLSEWERRRVAGGLADRAGAGTARQSFGPQDRLGKCCHGVRVQADTSPQGYRTASGHWKWTGVMVCKEKCCPKCGKIFAQKTARELGATMERWLAGDGTGLTDPDLWMITLAPPHAALDGADETVGDLYEMAPAFFDSLAWRRFAARVGLGAASRVRVLDSSFGGQNGPHPHFHCALFPSAARATGEERRRAALLYSGFDVPMYAPLDEDERAAYDRRKTRADADRERALSATCKWVDAPLTALDRREREVVLAMWEREAGLWEAWRDIIRDWKGNERVLFGRHRGRLVPRRVSRAALRLTPGEDAARYFTAWGLESEIGASPIKARSHLRLLDAAGAGVVEAGEEWQAWREATKGKQWVTGLADVRARLGVSNDDVQAYQERKDAERKAHRAALVALGLAEPERIAEPINIIVPAYLWSAACLAGLDVVERVAEDAAAAGASPQDAVMALCWSHQADANKRAAQHRRELLARPPPDLP